MKDILVTMAGDSYRVKTQQTEPRQCCHACKYCKWGVVLTLVLAALSLGTVAALTLSFCRQLEELRHQLHALEHRVTLKHDVVELMRAFENGIGEATHTDYPDESDEDDDDKFLDPTYPDLGLDELPVEDKTGTERPQDIPPLLPAAARHERSITPARLQLYHTLQTDAPQYAEHPALGYVTPPGWLQHTTRRPRAMSPGSRHRPRPMTLSQRLQHVPQPQDVPQDVAQEVTQSAESIDSTVEVERTWRPYSPVVEGPAIAAHFVADSSRHRSSHHFDGNGRLKHPQGDYGDWRASPWVQELGLDRHFRLAESSATSGGSVIVDTAGLYLVYAQVNYANEKDENGFWVYRNGQKELLCVNTASGSGAGSPRANTCFTAGVLFLRKGDRVALRDLAGDRYRVLDHGGRSFIGLVNLQGCKLKAEQPSRVTAGQ